MKSQPPGTQLPPVEKSMRSESEQTSNLFLLKAGVPSRATRPVMQDGHRTTMCGTPAVRPEADVLGLQHFGCSNQTTEWLLLPARA